MFVEDGVWFLLFVWDTTSDLYSSVLLACLHLFGLLANRREHRFQSPTMFTGFVVRYIFNIPEAALSFSTRSYLILSLSLFPCLSFSLLLNDACNYKSEPLTLENMVPPCPLSYEISTCLLFGLGLVAFTPRGQALPLGVVVCDSIICTSYPVLRI